MKASVLNVDVKTGIDFLDFTEFLHVQNGAHEFSDGMVIDKHGGILQMLFLGVCQIDEATIVLDRCSNGVVCQDMFASFQCFLDNVSLVAAVG